MASRDRYIGWCAEARRRNIRFLAYNTRYLILPWVRVPHLASHILGKMTSQLSQDWERMYGLSQRPSLIRADFGERVTWQPTGNCSAAPRAEAKLPTAQAEPAD
jgi:hypothetical protein